MNKRLFKTLLTSAVVLGSVAAPVAAFAQDYDSLIGQSESQIENLSAAQAQLYARVKDRLVTAVRLSSSEGSELLYRT